MSNLPAEKSEKNVDMKQKKTFLESIVRGQESLWNDPKRGLIIDPTEGDFLVSLQKEGLERNVPISHLLDYSSYNLENLGNALINIVYELYELDFDSDVDPVFLVNKMGGVLPETVNNVLKQNQGYFSALGDRLGSSSLELFLIGGAIVQPSLIALAMNCDRELLDAWEHAVCPVCGRIPSVAVKVDGEAWRFRCSYCRAEYRTDIYRCPHCGSEGVDNKEFLLVGENREYEVAACSDCNRYYKIINLEKLGSPIPEGLEESYTDILDEIAHGNGLIRLDEAADE